MVSKYPKMNKLFKGQISFKAVFSKCAQARYYHGILAATEVPSNSLLELQLRLLSLDGKFSWNGNGRVLNICTWWWSRSHIHLTFYSDSWALSNTTHLYKSYQVKIVLFTQSQGIGGYINIVILAMKFPNKLCFISKWNWNSNKSL